MIVPSVKQGYIDTYIKAGTVSDIDATAFFTAAGITDVTQKAAVTAMVIALKSASLWTKAKAIYPYVGGSASSHLVNLKSPGTYNITWNGGITHDANGVTFNGTTGYGDTGLNPFSVFGSSYLSMHSYVRTGNAGIVMATNQSNFAVYNASGQANASNGSTTALLDIGLINTGMLSVTRDSTRIYFVCDGNKVDLSTQAFVGNGNTNFHVGKYGGAGILFSNHNVAFQAIMDGLTVVETQTLHSIVKTYQTTLSRNITEKNFYTFFGDSLTKGFGVTPLQRYGYLVSTNKGYVEANNGISSTSMQNYPPDSTLLGMINRTSEIPTKNANNIGLFLAYGTNDARYQDSGVSGYSVATFQSNLATVIAAAKAKGWGSSNIFIIDGWYGSTTGGGWSTNGLTIWSQIRSAAQAECTNSGAVYINPFSQLTDADMQADTLHPNATGQSKNATYISTFL